MLSSRPLIAGALLTAALGSAATSSASAAELVSRATGADGAPFADGRLLTASRDGRFVLFAGPYNEAASAEPDFRRTFFLRDRDADTTTPVLRADGEFGVVWSYDGATSDVVWTAFDVSADGTKVLFSGPKQDGAPGTALYVRDLAAKTTTVVSTLPSGAEAADVAGIARFTNGGSGILFGTKAADGALATYTRALPSGTAELFQAGVKPLSATADGSTITWRRTLAPAKRPASSNATAGPATYGGAAQGYTVKGETPVISFRTKIVERGNAPTSVCATTPPSFETTTPITLTVNDTGTLLQREAQSSSSIYPYYPTSRSERSAEGSWPDVPRTTVGGLGSRDQSFLTYDLGETGETLVEGQYTANYGYAGAVLRVAGTKNVLPELPVYDRPLGTTSARLFDNDTGIIVSEITRDDGAGGTSPYGINTVRAYDPTSTTLTPVTEPTTPTQVAGEILDDASVTADVDWASCPEVPVGAATDYATATYAAPIVSTKSAGTVSTVAVSKIGSEIAVASTTTIKVSTLGFTTWTKTLTHGREVATATLPKPWLWLPQTVTIDTTIPGVGGQPTKHLVQKRSWQAWR